MKICFISPCDLSVENGGRTHTLELTRNWAGFGHSVFLFSRGLKEKDNGFRYVNLPFTRKGIVSSFLFSIASLAAFIAYHIRFRFDILFLRTSVFDFAIVGARLLRIPVVAELNDVPYSEAFSKEIVKESRLLRKSLLRIGRLVLKPVESLNFGISSRFVATAPRIKEMERYPGIQHKVAFIPFGANTELFRPLNKLDCRQILGLSGTDKVVCFVGSFHPWQGIEDLIRGVQIARTEVPGTKLLVVGDDDRVSGKGTGLRGEMEKLGKDLGLTENLVFTGRVPYERVPIYMNASDVCVSTLRGMRSGFSPLKLFEYLACGKPVVATDVEGVSEFLKESGAGTLVPPEDPKKLAAALTKLLKDENTAEQMGGKGHRYVMQNYSWENVANMAIKTCQEAINK